jgi:membrane peptidoglycan carboxypeptidase
VGNNDNTPMKKGGAALAGPIWNDVMKEALKNLPVESFEKPDPINPKLPPILRGFWQGGETFSIDTISGGLATEYTPIQTQKEQSITNVHTILYWINKNDPLGDRPTNPEKDPLFKNWEYGVLKWWNNNQYKYPIITDKNKPVVYDSIHNQSSKLEIEILGLNSGIYKKNEPIYIMVNPKNQSVLKKVDIFINNTYLTSLKNYPFSTSFNPSDINNIKNDNTIKVIGYDVIGNSSEAINSFKVGIN